MSTIRNPVGPQPPAVYWKRRALVLLGLVAVIVIIILIVVGGNRGETPQPKPSTSSSAQTDTNTSAEPVACNPEALSVTAVTDKGSYASGEQPLLSMTIENTGAAACTVNGGTDATTFTIVSGSEQYWSSADCLTDAAPAPTVLEPGVPKSTTPFAWERTRSSTTTCDAERPAVPAGGASYHLTVSLGDVESAQTKQFVLN